ncbi:MAG TPA: hypothetical protein VHM26_00100 [Chitinophagaceae bacterium]|jgi:hypothetical protein|nr:hypothetical protein [Chitinophagaceae bacterium]
MDSNLTSILEEIQSALQLPYATEVSAPAEATAFNSFSNFLRTTPTRKIFLINHTGGDYEYDEGMNIDKEIEMEIANDAVFSETLIVCENAFGKSLGEFPEDNRVIESNYDDNSKEGNSFDDIEWTPEYEDGAVFRNADSFQTHYWIRQDQFIFLQKGKWTGDGNFIFYVLITITPCL